MKEAKVLSIQFNPVLGSKEANYLKVGDIISNNSANGLDLVIVPEFFSTGIDDKAFTDSPEEEKSSPTLNYFSEIAREFNTNIVCGSIIEKADDNNLYNTSYALDRKGDIAGKYRKIHLFEYFGGNENKTVFRGDKICVVDFDFARVGLSLCFDIRFPAFYKSLIKAGAEIIVSPSAWSILTSEDDDTMADFINSWRAFNIARAADNAVYFVTANLIGKSYPFLYSIGNSMIVNPIGKILENAQNNEGGLYCELDMELVRKLKKDFPIYNLD